LRKHQHGEPGAGDKYSPPIGPYRFRRLSMSEEKKDFVVKDRRRFAQDDQEAESKGEEPQSPSSAEESQEPEDQKSSQTVESEEKPQLPEINFPTFKQTIDILSMLEEKTAGNLTSEEENLLKNILYDLRMMYVKEKG
jgi:hypothetical protein